MAIANQGYRRDLNLLETPSDFTALDNLGGVGISFDLQILQNNLRNISTAGFSTLTDGFFDFGTNSNLFLLMMIQLNSTHQYLLEQPLLIRLILFLYVIQMEKINLNFQQHLAPPILV